MAYDPSKVHRIEFKGKYQKFSGYGQLRPLPQRTPVLLQAGSSSAGVKFSGRNAEAVFTSHPRSFRILLANLFCKKFGTLSKLDCVECGS